ncbi:MAG TPA: phosphodiester glycosidase family protein, partial [Sphingobacterium sp.]|nr:phosphodiester glycosidase family protein [Sphingobacterium sp.]
MARKKISTQFITVTFTYGLFFLILSCGKPTVSPEVNKPPQQEEKDPKENEETSPPQPLHVVDLIQKNTTLVKSVISQNVEKLEQGITYTHLRYIDTQDRNMSIYVLVADMSYRNVNIQALNPYDSDEKRFQPLKDMVKDNEKTGTKILAAVNGDYFSWTNMETTGPFTYDGKVRKANSSGSIRPAFGITKTGLPVFLNAPTGHSNVYTYGDNLLRHLVGGNQWFIYNSTITPISDSTVEPRTSIGMREDKKIIAIAVDGRNANHSNGMSYVQLQSIYRALGAKFAFNLDGGGSTTVVVRKMNEKSWDIVNIP